LSGPKIALVAAGAESVLSVLAESDRVNEFGFDRRANSLREWRIDQPTQRLLLCAQSAVFRQIRLWLLDHRTTPTNAPFDDLRDAPRWTHCLMLDTIPEGLSEYLELLQRVVILRDLSSPVETGVALDFYTIPEDGVPSRAWLRTEVGELVHTFKYAPVDDLSKQHALQRVIDRLAVVLASIPTMSDGVVVSVPGHDSRQVAWSERLAAGVASKTGRRLVRAKAQSLIRPQAKERNVDLSGEFAIDPSDMANASSAVIVDDVMLTGSTLLHVARAARLAGALQAHALVAARTIR
jgi:hypothetical protein